MRVLFVTSELYPWDSGGPQNVVYNLANQLSGVIHLEMLGISPKDRRELSLYYRDDIVFHLIRDKGPGDLKYLFRNISYRRKIEGSDSPDIIHFHILPGANCAFLPHYLKKTCQAKLVVSLYDWVPEELRFYRAAERFRHLMHWKVAKHGLDYIDSFVVNSSYIKKIVEDYGLSNVAIIPNGIDKDEWTTTRQVALKGSLNILFWGRLYPKKGAELLIKAFGQNVKDHEDIHLYIGGKGPEEKRYGRLCGDLGLEDKVTFLGRLDQEDLKRYLVSCDFCVFPSIYEGFGISILEAMAASKPVITSKRGGQTDFAEDGYNALLVDLDEPRELRQAMEAMISSPPMRRSLGENAAETASQYNWPSISRDYIRLYESMMEGNG